jgi:4-amino-4-deoxy-L-arabinose transferase-like glycosyltransferase
MTIQPATNPAARPDGPETSIIPAPRGGVTALRTHAFLAMLVALTLRLLFVLRFPTSAADDSEMYIQFARTWADYHVYGFLLSGHVVPADLRMPGYPAFLAVVAMLFGRSIRAIMLSQAALDAITCFLTAALAAALAPAASRRRVWIAALWLAATCPFVANYSAVVLTEILVTFLATAALCCFALGLRDPGNFFIRGEGQLASPLTLALLGGFLSGLATLVRPEMPLLFAVAVLVYALRSWKPLGARKTFLLAAAITGAFLLPLAPWAARNYITLKRVQFLAPRYANFPGEYAPVGFYQWTATWLERYRDVYFTIWKIGEMDQPLNVAELPSAAFDSPEEKARIANLFSKYNDSPDIDISPELDRTFSEIARERTGRHPLRTYLHVPFERALTIWFTPRTELLPIDGKFWPVREQWADSHADVLVTASFAALGYLYVALAAGGVWIAWAAKRKGGANLWGIAFLIAYCVVRTAFLTIVEAPEPRYVVSCYPAVLALIALRF